MTSAADRQQGQIMVVFALSLLAMVAMLAVVIDGGFLYVQRRTAQTAADAGALAGARALRELSSLSTISTSARTMAANNAFGTTPTVECVYLVDTSGAALGTLYSDASATCPSGTPGSINGASGVHVDVTISFQTILAGILRISSLSADGHATAQLGTPGSINSIDSPLIVCGGGSPSYNTLRVAPGSSTSGYTPPVTVTNGQLSVPSPLPTYAVNGQNGSGTVNDQLLTSSGTIDYLNKTGYVYFLKGSTIGLNGSGCGTQSNTFDGGADPGPPPQMLTVPGDLVGSKGNNISMIGNQVATTGGCASGTDILSWTAGSAGCVIWLPVASGPLGGTGNVPTLVIPQIAPFYVWCNKGTGTQCQEFVGQLVQLDGTPAGIVINISVTGGALNSGVIVVHLTQ